MNPISEILTLIFRARELNRNDLLRLTRELLSLFDNSFLPKPKTIDPTGKKGFEIEIYSDLRIIKLVEIEAVGKQMPFTLDSDVSDFTVTITPSFREFVIGITLPQIIYTNISLKEIKELFLKICLLFNPDIGKCYPTKAYRMILDKYFEWEHRTSFFTFFCWLQYFSKKEFDRQGGEEIGRAS